MISGISWIYFDKKKSFLELTHKDVFGYNDWITNASRMNKKEIGFMCVKNSPRSMLKIYLKESIFFLFFFPNPITHTFKSWWLHYNILIEGSKFILLKKKLYLDKKGLFL